MPQPSDNLPNELSPFVDAMLGASGLTDFDAIASVLFALTTHINGLEQYPILVYLGAHGTGKSVAMRQLFPMCKDSRWIEGRTVATERDGLANVRTAFVDEADHIDSDANLVSLYTQRYSSQTGTVQVNVPGFRGYEPIRRNIFGATVMARRVTFGDTALRSRAIIIRTQLRPPRDWAYREITSVADIASRIGTEALELNRHFTGEGRVSQTWSILTDIAYILGMEEWSNLADERVREEERALRGGQGYEPSESILNGIDIASRTPSGSRQDVSIRVSEVARIVKDEFALTLRPNQIEEEARARGFEIGRTGGYKTIKVKRDLLDALLPE